MSESVALWEPSEKQSLFLAAPEQEVLYGGAAGGGKSDSLVIDALGMHQNAIGHSQYRAILFRKTYNELEELIDRSKELYPNIYPGARFGGTDKSWTFPSGAKIRFRHFDHPKDRFKYQGHAYHYIGWDELTQHESLVGYEYLISRLRARGEGDTLQRYVRATCNPGGFGHEPVRERFNVPDDGSAVQSTIPLEDDEGNVVEHWHRRFIPARIADNKYLANTNYARQLQLLGAQEKKALLDGRWDVVEIIGAIFAEELEQLYLNGQVCNIPFTRTSPVSTFWDLGRNDETAIWFMQEVAGQKRFIGYMEGRFKSIPYWARQVKEWGDKRQAIFEEHYMPHDVEVVQLGMDNRSRREMFESLQIAPITTVPRIESLREGIDVTREFLVECWFDREECKQGLKAIANYRRRFDEQQQVFVDLPMKNWARNGTDAIRQAAQGYATPKVKKPRRMSAPASISTI